MWFNYISCMKKNKIIVVQFKFISWLQRWCVRLKTPKLRLVVSRLIKHEVMCVFMSLNRALVFLVNSEWTHTLFASAIKGRDVRRLSLGTMFSQRTQTCVESVSASEKTKPRKETQKNIWDLWKPPGTIYENPRTHLKNLENIITDLHHKSFKSCTEAHRATRRSTKTSSPNI